MCGLKTPLAICGGKLVDREFNEVVLNAEYYRLPESASEMEGDIDRFSARGVNLIHLQLDETSLVDEKGAPLSEDVFDVFDRFVSETEKRGICVVLGMISKWRFGDDMGDLFEKRITDFDPIRAKMRRFEVYFTAVFTHVNGVASRPLYEFENVVAIEPLPDVSYMTGGSFRWFAFLLSPFIDHCFSSRIMKAYGGDMHAVPDDVKEKMFAPQQDYKAIRFVPDSDELAFDAFLPGMHKAAFSAEIKRSGCLAWHGLAAVETRSCTREPGANGGGEGFVSFASACAADLRFKFPVPVKSAKFRPSLKNPVEASVDGNSVSLTLENPRYGVLEVNCGCEDYPVYTVYILNDKVCRDPSLSEEYAGKVMYVAPGEHDDDDLVCDEGCLLSFLPGLHVVKGDKLNLASNRDMYLSRGAVLRAGIAGDNIENVRIFGQGVIDATHNVREPGENWRSLGEEGCLFFLHGKNVTIDGPVLYNPQFWAVVIAGTENMTIRNFKVLAWIVNDDGLQPRSCNNLLVENVFLKCMDDCVAIKTRKAIGMESRNLVFRDMVLWQDNAYGLEIGHTSQADILEDLRFENIEFVRGGRHAVSMNIMDHETVKNVVYENLYFEGIEYSKYVGLFIHGDPSPYRTDAECGHVDGVLFRNLYFEDKAYPAKISGYNEEHQVRNVCFENVFERDENGGFRSVKNIEALNIEQNFSSNVTFAE